MKQEFSAGGIIVKGIDGKPHVLLIEYQGEHKFGFPKGRLEAGETNEQAAVREIGEEVGLTQINLKKKLGDYQRNSFDPDTGVTTLKTVTLFLVEALDFTHAPDTHETYQWIPLNSAADMMKYSEDATFFRAHMHELN